MAKHKCRSARTAKAYASRARRKGLRASVKGKVVYTSRK